MRAYLLTVLDVCFYFRKHRRKQTGRDKQTRILFHKVMGKHAIVGSYKNRYETHSHILPFNETLDCLEILALSSIKIVDLYCFNFWKQGKREYIQGTWKKILFATRIEARKFDGKWHLEYFLAMSHSLFSEKIWSDVGKWSIWQKLRQVRQLTHVSKSSSKQRTWER